jgi:uncharacterized protein (TIGR02466 family)
MTLSTHTQQPGKDALSAAQATKVGVMPLFSSWIYRCENGPIHLNLELEALAHKLMEEDSNSTRRTNCGGWHYAFDLFELHDPAVAEFRDTMAQHVQAFLNHFRPEERKRKDKFRLRGWINVNHAGDFNTLHSHPGSFLSATYYVKIPQPMSGGEIYFRDPRGPAVAMYETPGIELPWVGSGVGIPFSPGAGHLLIFPSWLEHRVEKFEGAGERISVAFNASNP